MKKIAIIVTMLLAIGAMGQDTIIGLPEDCYCPVWYDRCQSFVDSSDVPGFIVQRHHGAAFPGGDSWSCIATEHRTDHPLSVKGVLVMAEFDSASGVPNFMPPLDSTRLPEYVLVCQGMEYDSFAASYQIPRFLTILDSVRWDTATPVVMRLPMNADSTSFLHCLGYKAYLASPVIVDSAFYLVGTLRSNSIYPADAYPANYVNQPTEYVTIKENPEAVDYCTRCRQHTRVFNGTYQYAICHGCWHEVGATYYAVGPFIVILE